MARAADHVVLYFFVGRSAEGKARIRFVVGGSKFEILDSSIDALGVSSSRWTPIAAGARGMPDAATVLTRALQVSYSDLPPRAPDDRRLYPDGITATHGRIEIELGDISS